MKPDLKCAPLARLRTHVWLNYCLQLTRLSAKAFQWAMVGESGEPGVEVNRWLSGTQSVGPQTVMIMEQRLLEESPLRLARARQEIEQLGRELGSSKEAVLDLQRSLRIPKSLSGSAALFTLPLWQLLDLRTFTEKKLFSICGPHLRGSPRDGVWLFPYDFYIHKYNKWNSSFRHRGKGGKSSTLGYP